jgi:hypothetical protein
VVVAAVNQDDLGIGVPQRVRRCDPGKATSNDNDALAVRGRHVDDGRLVGPRRGQHRAHWFTFHR